MEKKPYFHQCVERELRNVSDQTIDHLIKLAQKKKSLTHDEKLDALHIIAAKAGIHLNKNTVLDQTSLLYCPNVKEISVNWEKSHKSYFILKGSLLLYEQRGNEGR